MGCVACKGEVEPEMTMGGFPTADRVGADGRGGADVPVGLFNDIDVSPPATIETPH